MTWLLIFYATNNLPNICATVASAFLVHGSSFYYFLGISRFHYVLNGLVVEWFKRGQYYEIFADNQL